MAQRIVNIIDRQFNLLGQIDDFVSLIFTKSYSGIGSFELHVHESTTNADKLQKENIIFTAHNKAYVILFRSLTSIEGKFVVKGLDLKSYLKRLITFPPSGQAYHRISSNSETIMKEYVTAQLIRRNITDIIVSPNQNRGITTVYQTRYKNLADELEKLSLASGLGWDIVLDIENKKFIFDVYEGQDRTANQDILPPAIFSIEYDNIDEQTLVDSKLNYANIAVVAGQGEGADRVITEIGNAVGLDRYEVFVDARDIEVNDDLPSRGEQKLSEMKEIVTFDSKVLTAKNLIYEKDFNLGDIVTTQNKKWNVTLDTRINEITEVNEGEEFRLDITFGSSIPTLIDVIKQATDVPVVEGGTQGEPGTPGEDGIGLEYIWNDTQLGVKREDETIYQYVNLVGPKGDKGDQGPQGIQGISGINGKNLEFIWNGTQLGVRLEGESLYQYIDLKGDKGDKGDQGPHGKSIEYAWNGTQLGIRVEGESSYQYADLQGPPGESGASSWDEITDKPTTFPPSTHVHNELDSKPTYNISDTTLPSEINIAGGLRLDFINNFSGGGSGYRTILTLTGYQNNGLTQLAFNYNSNSSDVYIRIANYNTNTWSTWTLLGGSSGIKIITSTTEPSGLVAGDQWHKQL